MEFVMLGNEGILHFETCFHALFHMFFHAQKQAHFKKGQQTYSIELGPPASLGARYEHACLRLSLAGGFVCGKMRNIIHPRRWDGFSGPRNRARKANE